MKKLRFVCLALTVLFTLVFITGCGGSTNTGNTAGTAAATADTGSSAAPAKPVRIGIVDGAGELPLCAESIDSFKKEHPEICSSIELIQTSAPELATKLQAQQSAGNMDTTFVFVGYEGFSMGRAAGVYEQLLPKYQDKLPGLLDSYTEAATLQYSMTDGYAIPHVCSIGGPYFVYNPDKVKNPPTNLDELLAWAKANPNKLVYASPNNSGAGYAFLEGLPYLIGDVKVGETKDPSEWTKSWAYLKELGKYIEYYPTSSGVTYRELSQGTRDIIMAAVGFETSSRVNGNLPLTMKQGFFTDTLWVSDANFIAIPKGLDEASMNASLALAAYLMTPEQQALTYDSGFMYPGPAIKGVTLSMAPISSQEKLGAVLTTEMLEAIDKFPNIAPIPSADLSKAFDIWNKEVGAMKQ